MKKIYANNEVTAERIASDFFKKEFGHTGKVGVEKRTSSECGCGESAAIEFYSKDDPGMMDTLTVVICEECYKSQANVDKL